MKRTNKYISFILVSLLLLVDAALPSFAASEPRNISALLASLKITDGTEHEKETSELTRAAAADYALKISGHADILQTDKYGFSDVDAKTPYCDSIAYAASIGMIASGEKFYPNDSVTLAEFLKMVDAGLGYGAIADAMGGYPAGYMSVSKRVGMLKGIALGEHDGITYLQLEKLLSNILMSNYAELETTEKYSVSSDENVLYKVFGVYKLTGVLQANAVTSLNTPVGIGSGKIMVGGEIYDADSSLYGDIQDKIGYKLDLWICEKTDDDNDTVICFEENLSNDVTEIFSEDFESFSKGNIVYKSGGNMKKVHIPASANIIYNGAALTSDVAEDVFQGKWGSISVIAPSGGNAETVVITAYENYFVGGVNSDSYTVYDNTVNNRSISFEDKKNELSEFAYFRSNSGKKLSFSDITVNSVISVAQNGNCYNVIVTSESVTGTVKQIYTDSDNKTEIEVDMNRYTAAPELSASRIAQILTGNTYTFYLDVGGRISAGVLDSSFGREMQWAYLIDVIPVKDGINECLCFRVLSASGDVIRLRNADRMKIDGILYKNTDSKLKEVKGLFADGATDIVKSQVVRMSVDDNSCVSRIDTAAYNSEENRSDSVRQICSDSVKRIYKSGAKTFGTDFALSSGTVIFNIPDGKAESADKGSNEDYGITGTSIWTNDEEYNVSAYNTDIYSRVAGAVVTGGESVSSAEEQDYVTLVTRVRNTFDEDDNDTVLIEGIQNNAEIKLYCKDESVAKISAETYATASNASETETVALSKGDVIRYSINNEDKVSKIELLYDCSEKKLNLPSDAKGTESYGKVQLSIAKAYRISDGYIVTAVNNSLPVDDSANTQVMNRIGTARVYKVNAEGSKIETEKAAASDIRDWYNYGADNCSYLFVQNRYNECRTIIIYEY